jgi:hypothetical protein
MLEKLAIRRQLKKASTSFNIAKQELARLDKHFTVNPYTKSFYILVIHLFYFINLKVAFFKNNPLLCTKIN